MSHFDFVQRHIGVSPEDQFKLLGLLGFRSLDHLMDEIIPENIRQKKELKLIKPLTEDQALKTLKNYALKNKLFKSYIGMGYYNSFTPNVIKRCVLENPAWYTAYTPYQPEISQGRLEALINFQTMVQDLTAMDIANASLLDEGTALAEAVTMACQIQKKNLKKIFVLEPLFPQSLAVLQTRCEPLGLVIEKARTIPNSLDDYFCTVIQYPNALGAVNREELEKLCSSNPLCVVSADLLSLCLLTPPGELGADIVVGTTQRFGVPMGFGGPHAAYLATRESFKRFIPGRIVGVSKDSKDQLAYRLALQTREQHIRREKATSNICTSQVLLAVMAGFYSVYHGPKGLKAIAQRIHIKTSHLVKVLNQLSFKKPTHGFFDTFFVQITEDERKRLMEKSRDEGMNFNFFTKGSVGISLDETTSDEDINRIVDLFSKVKGKSPDLSILDGEKTETGFLDKKYLRTSAYMTHPVFNSFHSETEFMRYVRRLENKDLTLANSMIPLGSCTMKLNSATELIPITWPEFADLHPFAPMNQVQGTLKMIRELEDFLTEITGFEKISLQPNAGSQGEYAGLLAIKKYHGSRGQGQRNVCLIPSSAHGTNPASAKMCGMKVVIVNCDEKGNIDLMDLSQKAKDHKNTLAALMITYPSTHGVFEPEVKKICEIIHDQGGQVYMDGANLNAMVGLCQPGQFGPDVSHLNLHKTFCIPHGGGGPGVGPVAVAPHLVDFLPGHNLNDLAGPKTGPANISSAPWGSALILPISWSFIAMMGAEGLRHSSQVAILNANYVAYRLKDHYPILYTDSPGAGGPRMHYRPSPHKRGDGNHCG